MQQEDVAAFLRANPGFLAENPGLYQRLDPPARVHGAGLADHMAAMLDGARRRADGAERALAEGAADRRTAEGFTRRVNEAVLALMRAPDAAWLATHELAGLLQVDAARLCSEAAFPPAGAAPVPAGTVAAVLGQRRALVRPASGGHDPDALLHGEARALAAEEALLRVPLASGPALLALACRDNSGLAGASTDALTFLGQAVAAAMDAGR